MSFMRVRMHACMHGCAGRVDLSARDAAQGTGYRVQGRVDLFARDAAQALAAVDLAEVSMHFTMVERHVFAQVAQRLVDAAVVVGRRLYVDVLGDHLRSAR